MPKTKNPYQLNQENLLTNMCSRIKQSKFKDIKKGLRDQRILEI